MTNLTQVSQHAKIIAGAGGPEWYRWCDLKHSLIHATLLKSGASRCFNPLAREAAVVMFCGEVRAWLDRDLHGISINTGPQDGFWFVEVIVWEEPSKSRTVKYNNQLAASVALIAAVAEQIGGSDD